VAILLLALRRKAGRAMATATGRPQARSPGIFADEKEMTEDADISPEMPAYDEQGNRVVVVHPIYEQDDTQDDDASHKFFQEKLAVLLQWLAVGTVQQAGRRAFLLAHLVGKSGCASDRELAKKLNISPGRISQLRSEIIGDFGGLGRCNRRQN
jgi:hypothetical protein